LAVKENMFFLMTLVFYIFILLPVGILGVASSHSISGYH